VGVVAAQHGRRAVLIEQNPAYCVLAVQRLHPYQEPACAD
jgi:DNA modification methylase